MCLLDVAANQSKGGDLKSVEATVHGPSPNQSEKPSPNQSIKQPKPKNNGTKYPILSCVARDVFAIPVSNVASESAFSTGGRVLEPFRSLLLPDTVQPFICTQNWVRSSSTPINLQEAMDEVEQLEKID